VKTTSLQKSTEIATATEGRKRMEKEGTASTLDRLAYLTASMRRKVEDSEVATDFALMIRIRSRLRGFRLPAFQSKGRREVLQLVNPLSPWHLRLLQRFQLEAFLRIQLPLSVEPRVSARRVV
jgi:hypothetical protein